MAEGSSGVVALVVSTVIIVIFGEIIPQAICNKYGLFIGAHFTWLIYLLIALTFVISFPLSLLLKCILGEEEGNVYSKS